MRVVAGLACLLLVGMLLGASMLVYAAYVMLAVYWLTRGLASRWINALHVSRSCSATELEIGQSVAISLRIENRDRWPIVWVLIEDVLPRAALIGPPVALQREGATLRLCSLMPGKPKLLAYKLTALRRGYYQIGPAIAETGDLFGLHRRFRSLTQPAFLLVLPKLIPLSGYDVASRRPIGEVRVTYRLMDDPTLVAGIREYQIGDPLRSVHWRATARTGQLQCKTYQPTSVAGATLVIDMHQVSNPDRHEPLRTDLAVTAAASIAHTLMHMQQQFGVISNGRDAADRAGAALPGDFQSRQLAWRGSGMQSKSDRLRPLLFPTGRGPEHFAQLHKLLARLERTDGLRLPELLLETQSRLPRDATVMVIVQEVDEAAAHALGLLRRQGYSVVAIVNNYENDVYEAAVGRLMAQHIAVYHLLDEASLAGICQQLVLRF